MRSTRFLLPWVCATLFAVTGSSAQAQGGTLDLSWIEIGDAATVGALPAKAAALKAERRGGNALAARAKVPGGGKLVTVDCTKGQSIQAAIDSEEGPLVVEIEGVCAENVRIERKAVTLRGSDPATDGIRGVVADPQPLAVLEIYYADGAVVENLSIADGPQIGVGMWFSHVTMENCRVTGNGSTGIHVSSNSAMHEAVELTLSDNGGRGLHVQRSATVFCTGCVLEGNGSFAAGASIGGLLSLIDSVVSGPGGVIAAIEAYADVDCVSVDTAYPCSLTATLQAAGANSGGTAALYGVGDFSGNLLAVDRGHLFVYGSRQVSTGVGPGGAPRPNLLLDFATLDVQPFVDGIGVAHESRLTGDTHVVGFSRALLQGGTELDGTLACNSAGDAWTDGGVVLTPGSSITDCEHASPPP